jgi:site-specific DNA-methyltransferase (adenine-specific)
MLLIIALSLVFMKGKNQFDWKFNIKKKYNIIYADPPWKYGRTIEHYNCVPIKYINEFPAQQIAAENCALFLWVTYPVLPECIETLKKWGFRYVTVAFTWIKTNKNKGTPFIGLGNWTRANAEICLLGIKGNLKRQSNKVSQIVLSPLREHSRKPDEIRSKIVELMGDLPRIELFARQKAKGWDCWGNETNKFPKVKE